MKHTQSPVGHKTSLCDVYLKLFHQNDSFPKHYTICEYKTHMIKKSMRSFRKYFSTIETVSIAYFFIYPIGFCANKLLVICGAMAIIYLFFILLLSKIVF